MVDHAVRRPLSRRTFLKTGAATSGALVLGVYLPDRKAAAAPGASSFTPNAFVRIDAQGRVTLVMPMIEMGQGIYTAQAMLLAEELEVGLDQVEVEHAPPNDALYANSILHIQTAGASTSVRAFWLPLRQAGAVARSLLVSAAAAKWNVDPATCSARQGAVHHGPTSRQLGYGALVTAAAALPVPSANSVPLKNPKDFRLIGTPARRLDTSGQAGAHRCRPVRVAVCPCNMPSAVISRRWGKSK